MIKTENAQMEDDGKFITLNGILHSIINHHQYDDFGVCMDTYTIMNFAGDVKEIYSYDEGETFTFDVY